MLGSSEDSRVRAEETSSMNPTDLVAKIVVALKVVDEAQNDLSSLAAKRVSGSDDAQTEIEKSIRAAASRLKTAEHDLALLEQTLAAENTDSVLRTRVERAKTTVKEAEDHLDTMLEEMVAVPLQDSWVSESVEAAFEKLKNARKVLAALERSIDPDGA